MATYRAVMRLEYASSIWSPLASSTSINLANLCAKLLAACKVTAIWLNLSDSRNILIIHFGLLFMEHALDSIGHDVWKNIM